MTAVRLRLVRPVTASAVALVGVRDATDALEVVRTAVLAACAPAEILDDAMVRHVCETAALPWPLAEGRGHVLLVETESARPRATSSWTSLTTTATPSSP